MNIDKIRKTAYIYALQNAIQFDGKANVKAVAGKVISELKDDNIPPKDIYKNTADVVKEVNNVSLDKQKKELEKLAPELLVKEKKQRDFSLPDLPDAKKGGVITRFPPEPNGYLHIGHAKAVIVDYEYAKKYDGKFILRFDDTNPENADIEFYDAQKEDLKWLNISWDEEYNTSDNIEKHYKLAEKLILNGDAYVCSCESSKIKECRFNGTECSCRDCECGEGIDLFHDMISGGLNDAILRLRGDMKCVNTAMRDPTLFRIIEKTHPLQGDKYRVWPTYDFTGAVEDSISGVTHPFRTKEYELRDECYFRLLDLLDLRKPYLMEFARLNIKGMPVSKRKIKPLIDQKLVFGYDDIRLPTLRGLKKRGIKPQAIKNFVLKQGISKVESIVDFSILESENRKIIDKDAKRYFFVKNPLKIKVKEAPEVEKKIPLHPTNRDLGYKKIKTNDIFYVQKEDMDLLKFGDVFRLKELFNVKIIKKNKDIFCEYAGDKLIPDSLKIQWTTDEYLNSIVLIPHLLFINNNYNSDSLEKVYGFTEKAISEIKNGEIVQLERFGFARIEKDEDKIIGYFTHK